MTARELCNYLVAVASGDYTLKISEFNHNGSIIFTKFIADTQIFNTNTYICYDVYRTKTCKDFVYFVARHNLEDYAIISPVREWRVVNYMDISVDPVKREVVFR